jgi:hypothetical protein
VSEQADSKSDALDVAASGTPGGAAIAFGAPAAVAGAAATVFAALAIILARVKQLRES